MRILVVEDDKHTRRILESLLTGDPQLQARGSEVVLTEDGKAGLEALARGPFDLVISDLLMPRMDGFAFCRELRKHPQGQKVPLIVTSAIYKDPQTVARLREETGAEFFSKPFQLRDLMVAVRRLLGETDAPAQPVRQAAAVPQRGQLADRPPPRLLLDLADERATGVLTLERGKVRKDVTLRHGTPVACTSNLRTETLGHFLVGRGVIDEASHRQALERAQQSQERLGHILVELGLVDEQALLKLLGAQMRAKIVNLLRWKDGAWSFQPREPDPQQLETPVEAARLVFSGLQKTAHVDEIAQELAKVRGRVALTVRAERHREAFAGVFGAQGLAQLQLRPLLEELMAGVDPSAVLIQLDVLLVCGLAEIEPAAGQRAPARAADPASLERILAKPEPQAAPAPARSLYDELFGDEISEVKAMPGPPGVEEDEDEVSGVMQLPTGESAQHAAAMVIAVEPAPDPQAERLRKEVLNEYLAVHGKDYYQVLGLARDAAPEDVAEAYARQGKRFRLERFTGVDLGRDYARLEELHQIFRQAFETLSSPAKREQYDRVLDARERPSRASVNADLLAQEALALLGRGDAVAARTKLIDAVAAAPDTADYHALLGWAVFLADGGAQKDAPAAQLKKAAAQAWLHLDQAFAIDADSIDAHDYAGRIAAAAGDDARAVRHLERVLDADPTRADALAALEAALGRRGDFRRLERQYRKLIHRLGDKHDPDRALRLWWRLAELYRTRLGDRQSARVAYEIAAKLAPDDPRPREALARLHAEDPSAWPQAAEALRESWRLAPDEPRPGLQLFELHVGGGRWDAALQAALALDARGLDVERHPELRELAREAEAFARRYRPRFLQRAATPLPAKVLDAIRHPDEDRDLEQLFARVFAAWQPPLQLGDLGVTAADQVAAAALPEPFGRVLAYVGQALAVAPPPVYRCADFGADAHVGALAQPVLLAGPQALSASDKLQLAFRLGRALTFLKPGRAVAAALPARQLKAALIAALTLVQPSLKIDDEEGHVASLRGQLAHAQGLARELGPIVERILKSAQSTLNLTRYARGLSRTADRVGLLLCGDVAVATRIAADSMVPGASEDLLDFALSPEYLAARDAIGLSVAV